jgi:hypothetical protein
MANEKHVVLLKQGVEVWNKWRWGNPDVKPDLGGAAGATHEIASKSWMATGRSSALAGRTYDLPFHACLAAPNGPPGRGVTFGEDASRIATIPPTPPGSEAL